MAIRNGWEGRVLVEMHLDLEGRLAGVRLVASSGYAILDDATITAVRHASPFPPVARVVTVPVEYRRSVRGPTPSFPLCPGGTCARQGLAA
jgi:TonB family protein